MIAAKTIAGPRIDSAAPLQRQKSPMCYICDIFGAPRSGEFDAVARRHAEGCEDVRFQIAAE
jgi:hypothetical protein